MYFDLSDKINRSSSQEDCCSDESDLFIMQAIGLLFFPFLSILCLKLELMF